jgi:hypothetical protein
MVDIRPTEHGPMRAETAISKIPQYSSPPLRAVLSPRKLYPIVAFIDIIAERVAVLSHRKPSPIIAFKNMTHHVSRKKI